MMLRQLAVLIFCSCRSCRLQSCDSAEELPSLLFLCVTDRKPTQQLLWLDLPFQPSRVCVLVFTRTCRCYTTTNSERNHGNLHPRRRVNENILEHSAPAEMRTCLLPVCCEDDVRLICTWAKLRRDTEQGHLCSSKNGWKS